MSAHSRHVCNERYRSAFGEPVVTPAIYYSATVIMIMWDQSMHISVSGNQRACWIDPGDPLPARLDRTVRRGPRGAGPNALTRPTGACAAAIELGVLGLPRGAGDARCEHRQTHDKRIELHLRQLRSRAQSTGAVRLRASTCRWSQRRGQRCRGAVASARRKSLGPTRVRDAAVAVAVAGRGPRPRPSPREESLAAASTRRIGSLAPSL